MADLVADKTSLIDRAIAKNRIRSIVDLGACYLVAGGYSFYALDQGVERAVLVDGRITQETRDRAKDNPGVEIISGPLGDVETVRRIGEVDAAIMFSILLHQVAPDWDEFLKLYSGIPVLIIYNPNWTGTKKTMRFIDLGLDLYLKRVYHTNAERTKEWFDRHHEFNEEQNKCWRDVHNYWQWGITDQDLLKALRSLGYSIDFFCNFGLFNSRFPEIERVGLVASRNP